MKLKRLPISHCHSNCPKCNLPTDFLMFESGIGGNFTTYIGAKTGKVYRLDENKIHYMGNKRSDILAEALKLEGALTIIPQEIYCKICGIVFEASPVSFDSETIIEAYEL